MAGSAQGMAKAHAARMAKIAARRAAAAAQANDSTTPNDRLTTINDASPSPSLAVVDRSDSKVSENQTLHAARVLQFGASDAADTVVRVSSGRIRAPVAVRLQASLAVLQGLGLLGVKPGAGAADLEAAAGAVLSKLEGAMRLRDRREGASDANILPSGRVLEAEKPDETGS